MTRSNNLQRLAAVLVACALQLPVGANSNDNSRDSRDGYNYYDNGYNNNNNNGDDGDNDGNVLTRFADRVGYDMSDMWQTAPNTWATEYWEVFVVVAVIAFVLLGLHCCMAYDMCCGSNDDADRSAVAGARLAMTHEQMEERRLQKEKEQQLLENDDPLHQSGEAQEEFEKELARTRQLHADVPKLKRPVGPFDAVRTTTTTSAPPQVESKKPTDYWNDVKRRSRRAYRVGAEVVSLWSEFLSDLMPQHSRDNKSNSNDDEDGDTENNYKYRQHRHADEGSSIGRHSKRSASSSRRSSSRQHRQSRRCVDVGSPIDESAPSSSRPADNICEHPTQGEIRGFV